MVKLVLLHKDDSQYNDVPETRYDFPRRYLKAVEEGIGDWAVYYEPVKAGSQGYFAAVRIEKVEPNPHSPGRFLALMAPRTFLPFDKTVSRLRNGTPIEAALRDEHGNPRKGGVVQSAVRRLSEAEFAQIVNLGLPVDLEAQEARRYDPQSPDVDEAPEPFVRPVLERLTHRPYRDVAFRRKVRAAYGDRCAMSGLRLTNGGGRPEVQAAHIRPVERQGSDSVRNGLALSGTLHWMFDRGLVSVADDGTILVSRNKVPREVTDRLLVPDGKLRAPLDSRDRPHPENLHWHRENVFGQVASDGPAPWG